MAVRRQPHAAGVPGLRAHGGRHADHSSLSIIRRLDIETHQRLGLGAQRRMADYDRFLDAVTATKTTAGVKNTATAFGLVLDIVESLACSVR